MSEIRGQQRGDLTVEDGDMVEIRGQLVGRLVINGGTVDIRGQVTDRIDQHGGYLSVRGMACGGIFMTGGDADIHGMVIGVVEHETAATVMIHPGAQIIPN